MKKRILCFVLAVMLIISSMPFAFAAQRGDANDDGKVDSRDALVVLQYSAELTDKLNVSNADVDANGKINSTDALIILQISVGILTGVKAGFIYLDNENSAYDKNFMQSAKAACIKLGIEYMEKTDISESTECTSAAEALVKAGCTFIFADSLGHEEFLLKAAKKYSKVQFVCASGMLAHTEKLSNFHNAYASAYEGRYLTGIAAGLKLNEMISDGKFTKDKAKLGFVGSYALEMISDYTAFYLGAKSVCPSVKMDVQLVGNWHDEDLNKEAAEKLIKNGCKILCEYNYSPAAAKVCEKNSVVNVAYNGTTADICPKTSLISAKINWEPYFSYALNCVLTGKSIKTDYCGSLKDGSVVVEGLNKNAAAKDTELKLALAENNLKNGLAHVFDVSTFTVNNQKMKSYKADVDFESDYDADTEAISNGYFHECEYRSAPYFDLKIDGITVDGSNSPLVTYKNITTDCNSPRSHVIDTITIHCYIGQVTAKEGCDFFVNSDRYVSANYVVGKDGSIGLSVPESARAWTSSSYYNDQRAITIEVACDTTAPYAVTSKAYTSLINLCADICARNGIKKLIWKNDTSLIGQPDRQNMSVHRWFSATDCPGDYLMEHMSEIASKANAKIPK